MAESVRDAFREAYSNAASSLSKTAVEEPPDTATDDDEIAAPPASGKKTAGAEPEGDEPAPDESGLLSDAEFTTLQTTHKDDPAALRKSLEVAFTKKTQKIAEQRRSYERLQAYQPLIEEYEADPDAFIRRLATDRGLKFSEGGEAETAKPSAQATHDAEFADFKKTLGPDLEYLAETLFPAFNKLVDLREERIVQRVEKQTGRIVDEQAAQETSRIMGDFGKDHPDWKEHEKAMMQLADRIKPNGTITMTEYLGLLYDIVTREPATEREVARRLKKRLEKLNTGESGGRTNPSDEAQVRKRPDGPVSFQKAAEDARAGIRYDD